MKITRYITDLMDSNMYTLEENGHMLVIDPYERYDPADVINPDLIIITHEHYDHISGVNRLKAQYGTPLLCNDTCAARIVDSKKNMARFFEAFSQLQTYSVQDRSVPIDSSYTCKADLTFEDELRFNWQGNELWLFSLPGHSPGSIGIIVNNEIFFSGDSLLPDAKTEFCFPGGSEAAWKEISEKKLENLSDDLLVYPGHKERFLMRERRKNGCISHTGN